MEGEKQSAKQSREEFQAESIAGAKSLRCWCLEKNNEGQGGCRSLKNIPVFVRVGEGLFPGGSFSLAPRHSLHRAALLENPGCCNLLCFISVLSCPIRSAYPPTGSLLLFPLSYSCANHPSHRSHSEHVCYARHIKKLDNEVDCKGTSDGFS